MGWEGFWELGGFESKPGIDEMVRILRVRRFLEKASEWWDEKDFESWEVLRESQRLMKWEGFWQLGTLRISLRFMRWILTVGRFREKAWDWWDEKDFESWEVLRERLRLMRWEGFWELGGFERKPEIDEMRRILRVRRCWDKTWDWWDEKDFES